MADRSIIKLSDHKSPEKRLKDGRKGKAKAGAVTSQHHALTAFCLWPLSITCCRFMYGGDLAEGYPKSVWAIFSPPPVEITFETMGESVERGLHGSQLRWPVARLLEFGAYHRSIRGDLHPDCVCERLFAGELAVQGANLFFAVLVVGAFIPYQVMIYPIVIILREVGIYGSLSGLVIVHTIFGMPILTLLFRNYFTHTAGGIVQGSARGLGRILADLFPHHAAHVHCRFLWWR